jgi:hypothetical protein
MKSIRFALVLAAALGSGGCFQVGMTIAVNGDGSGTLNQRLLFTTAAVNQFRGLSILGGGNGRTFDPVSEEQARGAAATLGPGVTYVTSTPIDTSAGQGRDITYAFTDINQLRLSETPPAFGGARVRSQALGNTDPVSFALTRQPSGTALLRINVPRPTMPNGDSLSPTGRNQLSVDQMEMFKQMLVGARISIAVQPSGRLVRTSSPFVDGQTVTLLDVSLDQLLDDAVVSKLQQAKTESDAKAILANVPGVKINFDQEVTIEFQ